MIICILKSPIHQKKTNRGYMFVVVGAVCVWEFAYCEVQLVEWASMAVLDLSMLAGKPHASSASGKMLALVTFP